MQVGGGEEKKIKDGQKVLNLKCWEDNQEERLDGVGDVFLLLFWQDERCLEAGSPASSLCLSFPTSQWHFSLLQDVLSSLGNELTCVASLVGT